MRVVLEMGEESESEENCSKQKGQPKKTIFLSSNVFGVYAKDDKGAGQMQIVSA